MAYTTINKSTDYFNTITYSNAGDGAKAVTGVGFQPDLVWLKNRTSAYHGQIHDAVRGATNGSLYTSTNSQVDSGYALSSFDSDGFTTGSQSTNISQNSASQVAWNWKAGTTSGLSGGTITPSAYSINTTSGFSIIKWTGTSSAGTIPHGLGVKPAMIIIKRLTAYDENWVVYHHKLNSGTNPEVKYLELNSTNAQLDSSSTFNDQPVTNSVFNVNNDGTTNSNSSNYIAYCFAEKAGYSKFGSYTGNGNADGTFIYTGFKPAWVMIKISSGNTGGWDMYDAERANINPADERLQANSNSIESTSDAIDILSNGFKIRNTSGNQNGSGNTYIYMAFGQSLVGSNNVPCTAR